MRLNEAVHTEAANGSILLCIPGFSYVNLLVTI
jgi:hypothetical protein